MDYLVEISRSNVLKPKDLWFRVSWKESNLLSLKPGFPIWRSHLKIRRYRLTL